MIEVVQAILKDEVLFVVVKRGDEWTGTTLVRRDEPRDLPELGPGEVAHVVSWSGQNDRTVRF